MTLLAIEKSRVLVKEGDLVEPGQVVVHMDTADLEADRRTSDAQLVQAPELEVL